MKTPTTGMIAVLVHGFGADWYVLTPSGNRVDDDDDDSGTGSDDDS